MEERYKKVCERCGSEDIVLDAHANWDTLYQEWVLLTVYDDCFCNNCNDTTHIIDIKIEPITADQLHIIDILKLNCTFDDEQLYKMLLNVESKTYDEGQELIKLLELNQLDPLDRLNYNQKSFAKSNKSF